jgi:hypothetical protein
MQKKVCRIEAAMKETEKTKMQTIQGKGTVEGRRRVAERQTSEKLHSNLQMNILTSLSIGKITENKSFLMSSGMCLNKDNRTCSDVGHPSWI